MNPFDLAGPQFLGFYLVFGLAILLALVLVRHSTENADTANVRLTDPYMIAYLRGGKNEALRVAAASLLDRKLLTMNTTKGKFLKPASYQLVTSNAASVDLVKRPIERSILEAFTLPADVTALFRDRRLAQEADGYRQELIKLGLLPGGGTTGARNILAAAALVLLGSVAAIKIAVALGRGRTNIGFLIVMAAVFCFAAFRASHPRRTRSGDLLLGDLKTLFAGLVGRAVRLAPGGANNEAAFLAAVYGLEALPAETFPYVRRLRAPTDSTGGDYGSSSGSSCGGGCGGGGCGGGCGGCGS